jgi:hypothetical protein
MPWVASPLRVVVEFEPLEIDITPATDATVICSGCKRAVDDHAHFTLDATKTPWINPFDYLQSFNGALYKTIRALGASVEDMNAFVRAHGNTTGQPGQDRWRQKVEVPPTVGEPKADFAHDGGGHKGTPLSKNAILFQQAVVCVKLQRVSQY